MRISLNPSYFCNFRCSFCYLGDKLGDRQLITESQLRSVLEEISFYRSIEGIDIYGGEVLLIPKSKFYGLVSVIREFFDGRIELTTNLSLVTPVLDDPQFRIFVSYDGEAREKSHVVLENMRKLNRPFHVLMLSSEQLVRQPVQPFIDLFNQMPFLQTVEIKPYSRNQYNEQGLTWEEQELWVQRWLESASQFQFEFMNKINIEQSLNKSYSAYSDEHVYVTPKGRLAVLDFDHLDREYFHELDGFPDFMDWCFREKDRAAKNHVCHSCEFFGSCLTEHWRAVESKEKSCNGGYKLLKWYEAAQHGV